MNFLSRAGLAVFLPMMLANAADADLWRWVHPEAKVILGVDWKRAKESPAGQLFQKQLKESDKSSALAKGIPFLGTVDRILFSSPGGMDGRGKDSRLLIALDGEIDRELMKRNMVDGTVIERFSGVDLLIPPPDKGENMIAAVINERTALLGDRASIEQVLEGKAPFDNAGLRSRGERMAAGNEIWLVSAAPPLKSAPQGIPMPGNLDSIKALDLGISLASGFGLNASMRMADAEKARGFAAGIQMLSSLMISNQKAPPELADIARSLQVAQDGSQVTMNLNIPLEVLEKGMLRAKSGFETMGREAVAGMLSGQMPKPSKTREPERTTIRIYGMEGGVKEIPLTPEKKE